MNLRNGTRIGVAIVLFLGCDPPERSGKKDRGTDSDRAKVDSSLAGVFKPWDGRWKGTFHTYERTKPVPELGQEPDSLHLLDFDTLPLKKVETLHVKQIYRSISPFRQTVTIIDKPRDKEGKTVKSRGMNKVVNGSLWCIVEKPDEKVIHNGIRVNDTTLIWYRDQHNPLKKEYFRETASSGTYRIKGWGYYDPADTGKAPPLWFKATYQKIPEDG